MAQRQLRSVVRYLRDLAGAPAVEPSDPGFHGFRAECRDCGQVIAVRAETEGCPLCDGPGPLRARPG